MSPFIDNAAQRHDGRPVRRPFADDVLFERSIKIRPDAVDPAKAHGLRIIVIRVAIGIAFVKIRFIRNTNPCGRIILSVQLFFFVFIAVIEKVADNRAGGDIFCINPGQRVVIIGSCIVLYHIIGRNQIPAGVPFEVVNNLKALSAQRQFILHFGNFTQIIFHLGSLESADKSRARRIRTAVIGIQRHALDAPIVEVAGDSLSLLFAPFANIARDRRDPAFPVFLNQSDQGSVVINKFAHIVYFRETIRIGAVARGFRDFFPSLNPKIFAP